MLVPNAENAIVDIRKLTDYSLNPNHEIGKHKAYVFEKALGITIENAEILRAALLFSVRNNEARIGRFDRYGQRYTVDFEVERDERKATVRSGWIIETNTSVPHLTTCFICMKDFKLFDVVALKVDLPSENLRQGQVGTIVEVYKNGEAFEVEFVNTKGETYGLLTLRPEQVMLLRYEPAGIAA